MASRLIETADDCFALRFRAGRRIRVFNDNSKGAIRSKITQADQAESSGGFPSFGCQIRSAFSQTCGALVSISEEDAALTSNEISKLLTYVSTDGGDVISDEHCTWRIEFTAAPLLLALCAEDDAIGLVVTASWELIIFSIKGRAQLTSLNLVEYCAEATSQVVQAKWAARGVVVIALSTGSVMTLSWPGAWGQDPLVKEYGEVLHGCAPISISGLELLSRPQDHSAPSGRLLIAGGSPTRLYCLDAISKDLQIVDTARLEADLKNFTRHSWDEYHCRGIQYAGRLVVSASGSREVEVWAIALVEASPEDASYLPDVVIAVVELDVEMRKIENVVGLSDNDVRCSSLKGMSNAKELSIFCVEVWGAIFIGSQDSSDLAVLAPRRLFAPDSLDDSHNEPPMICVRSPEGFRPGCSLSVTATATGCQFCFISPHHEGIVSDLPHLQDPPVLGILQTDGMLNLSFIDCAVKRQLPAAFQQRASLCVPSQLDGHQPSPTYNTASLKDCNDQIESSLAIVAGATLTPLPHDGVSGTPGLCDEPDNKSNLITDRAVGSPQLPPPIGASVTRRLVRSQEDLLLPSTAASRPSFPPNELQPIVVDETRIPVENRRLSASICADGSVGPNAHGHGSCLRIDDRTWEESGDEQEGYDLHDDVSGSAFPSSLNGCGARDRLQGCHIRRDSSDSVRLSEGSVSSFVDSSEGGTASARSSTHSLLEPWAVLPQQLQKADVTNSDEHQRLKMPLFGKKPSQLTPPQKRDLSGHETAIAVPPIPLRRVCSEDSEDESSRAGNRIEAALKAARGESRVLDVKSENLKARCRDATFALRQGLKTKSSDEFVDAAPSKEHMAVRESPGAVLTRSRPSQAHILSLQSTGLSRPALSNIAQCPVEIIPQRMEASSSISAPPSTPAALKAEILAFEKLKISRSRCEELLTGLKALAESRPSPYKEFGSALQPSLVAFNKEVADMETAFELSIPADFGRVCTAEGGVKYGWKSIGGARGLRELELRVAKCDDGLNLYKDTEGGSLLQDFDSLLQVSLPLNEVFRHLLAVINTVPRRRCISGFDTRNRLARILVGVQQLSRAILALSHVGGPDTTKGLMTVERLEARFVKVGEKYLALLEECTYASSSISAKIKRAAQLSPLPAPALLVPTESTVKTARSLAGTISSRGCGLQHWSHDSASTPSNLDDNLSLQETWPVQGNALTQTSTIERSGGHMRLSFSTLRTGRNRTGRLGYPAENHSHPDQQEACGATRGDGVKKGGTCRRYELNYDQLEEDVESQGSELTMGNGKEMKRTDKVCTSSGKLQEGCTSSISRHAGEGEFEDNLKALSPTLPSFNKFEELRLSVNQYRLRLRALEASVSIDSAPFKHPLTTASIIRRATEQPITVLSPSTDWIQLQKQASSIRSSGSASRNSQQEPMEELKVIAATPHLTTQVARSRGARHLLWSVRQQLMKTRQLGEIVTATRGTVEEGSRHPGISRLSRGDVWKSDPNSFDTQLDRFLKTKREQQKREYEVSIEGFLSMPRSLPMERKETPAEAVAGIERKFKIAAMPTLASQNRESIFATSIPEKTVSIQRSSKARGAPPPSLLHKAKSVNHEDISSIPLLSPGKMLQKRSSIERRRAAGERSDQEEEIQSARKKSAASAYEYTAVADSLHQYPKGDKERVVEVDVEAVKCEVTSIATAFSSLSIYPESSPLQSNLSEPALHKNSMFPPSPKTATSETQNVTLATPPLVDPAATNSGHSDSTSFPPAAQPAPSSAPSLPRAEELVAPPPLSVGLSSQLGDSSASNPTAHPEITAATPNDLEGLQDQPPPSKNSLSSTPLPSSPRSSLSLFPSQVPSTAVKPSTLGSAGFFTGFGATTTRTPAVQPSTQGLPGTAPAEAQSLTAGTTFGDSSVGVGLSVGFSLGAAKPPTGGGAFARKQYSFSGSSAEPTASVTTPPKAAASSAWGSGFSAFANSSPTPSFTQSAAHFGGGNAGAVMSSFFKSPSPAFPAAENSQAQSIFTSGSSALNDASARQQQSSNPISSIFGSAPSLPNAGGGMTSSASSLFGAPSSSFGMGGSLGGAVPAAPSNNLFGAPSSSFGTGGMGAASCFGTGANVNISNTGGAPLGGLFNRGETAGLFSGPQSKTTGFRIPNKLD